MVIYHKGWDTGKLWGETVEEQAARILEAHPIEFEERISTLDRPLIIENAFPGWQPRYWAPAKVYPFLPPGHKEGGVRYDAVRFSIQEQVAGHIEAIKAGAAAVHLHPRDPKDGSPMGAPKNVAEIYDLVLKEVDAITLQHTWKVRDGLFDYVADGIEMLKLGKGNRYCQGAVVLWPPADTYPSNYTAEVQRGVKFMLENNIKPIHKLRSSYSVRKMKRLLMDTGVETQSPYVLVHDMGHPFGWPMDKDPWMPIDLIASIRQTKERIPDSIIGVYSGGRNWLPITITAILAGVDLIRVGIEDCYWMYPHKEEVIQRNIDAVNKVTEFARIIGREIATVDQARTIMGIKRTS